MKVLSSAWQYASQSHRRLSIVLLFVGIAGSVAGALTAFALGSHPLNFVMALFAFVGALVPVLIIWARWFVIPGPLSWKPFLVVVPLFAVLFCWIVAGIREAREGTRAANCNGRLNQLQFALQNYHATYGSFPPAIVSDASGKPMHSWRVLILPFIDQADVYAEYDFGEPWNGPNNSKLAYRIYNDIFHCASGPHKGESPITDYVAIVGPQTAFPGRTSTSLADMRDGPGNTILVVEVANSNIHWMEPRDLRADAMSFVVNDPASPSISSPHSRGPAVVFADHLAAYRLDASLRPETLKALTTVAGEEGVSREQLLHRSESRGRYLAE